MQLKRPDLFLTYFSASEEVCHGDCRGFIDVVTDSQTGLVEIHLQRPVFARHPRNAKDKSDANFQNRSVSRMTKPQSGLLD